MKQLLGELRALLRMMFGHRLMATGVLALLLANAALEGLGLGLLLPIIERFTTNRADNAVVRACERVLAHMGLTPGLYALLLVFLGLILVKSVLGYAQKYLAERLRFTLVDDICARIFRNFLDAGYSFFHTVKKGDLLNVVYNFGYHTGHAAMYLIEISFRVLLIASYTGLLFLVSWRLALLSFTLSALSLLLFRRVVRRIHGLAKRINRLQSSMNSRTIEAFDGIKVIKSFNTEDHEFAVFLSGNRQFIRRHFSTIMTIALVPAVKSPVNITILIAVIFISTRYLNVGIAEIGLFIIVLYRFLPAMQYVTDTANNVVSLLPSVDRALEAMRRDNKPYLPDGATPLPAFNGALVLAGVGFRYPTSPAPVLQGVSITIPRNSTVGIVGASGGGKSTLIDLLLRLYDPTEGAITVDGHDLRDVRLADWHRLISVVAQDTFLFDDTVSNNIRYGSDGADEAAVVRAARLARADEFITALPHGYQTRIGERGVKLSGGQKQRIALARTLLRDPAILILDEATSALDSASERLIQDSIDQLTGTKTIIIIAHRLSTLQRADHIVVIERGRVVEQGAPAELLAADSYFRRYRDLQHWEEPQAARERTS